MKEFLEILNKRLYFLSKEERTKVLEEYRDAIEQNYRESHNMQEAIDSVGDTESIVIDVCKKYNLNPDICVRENKFDKDVKACSNLIGNFIRDILKIVRKVSLQRNLESFLEVCIKIIFLLVVYTLIKLPFIGFERLSAVVNNFLFYPYNKVFEASTNSLLSLCYFVICIILTLKTFGNYRVKAKRIVDENKIKQIDKEYDWLDLIIRLLLYLLILIPIGILIIFNICLVVTFIYLISTGINLIGIPVFICGLTGLLICLFLIVLDGLKQRDRTYISLVVFSLALFLSGVMITIYNYSTFKHSNDMNKSNVEMTTKEVKVTLKKEIKDIYVINGDYEVLLDNELGDNELRLVVTYCDDYLDFTYDQVSNDEVKYLYIKGEPDKSVNYDKLISDILKDLRSNYIFNYKDARMINVKIYANKETKEKIEG